MLKNYITVSVRNLRKNKFFSIINVSGLSVGIASCILILLFVQNELSYDSFHENSDKLYRITGNLKMSGQPEANIASSPHSVGPMFKNEFPEVVNYVRIQGYNDRLVVRYKDKLYNEDRFLHADSTFLTVFSFELVKGDKRTALVPPNSVVITEDIAEKYFGEEDPIGKVLTFSSSTQYTVTGVIKNFPQNSYIKPELIGSISTLGLRSSGNVAMDLLSNMQYHTFFQLQNEEAAVSLRSKFPEFVERNTGAVLGSIGATFRYGLQPLTSIYLHSNQDYELESTSDISYVYLFTGIGFLILMIACLNYMNLSTARSANRAKEVGLRKVVGARRQHLIWQFFGESFVVVLISLIAGMIIAYLALPQFNTIARKELTLSFLSNPVLLAGTAGLLFFITTIGGSYPALFLSAFKPVQVIKGVLKKGAKGSLIRVMLVSFQFTVTIALIAGTLIVYNQLEFLQNKRLGYEKDHIVWIRLRGSETQQQYRAIKERLLQHPNILKTAASGNLPLGQASDTVHHPGDKPQNVVVHTTIHLVDNEFADLYNMEIIKGRNFSEDFPSDIETGAIVNETAVKMYGWDDDPIGKDLEYFTSVNSSNKKKIIGVVRDYHFRSLHDPISPLVMYMSMNFGDNDIPFSMISAKIESENIQETISFIENMWAEFDQTYPLEYGFVDEKYDELYSSEERLGRLFSFFTILAIVIGCLGLLGLASYTSEQRTKEIGIRKSLGASTSGIVGLLITEFIKLVIAANVIAWPLCYFFMNNWLRNFAYRADVGIWVFVLSGALALLIGLLTVSYQSVKAALSNPVNSLRYE
ncbi:MAG: FtsX-like permease family protein [bacterium]|nr:FtsX-like permease family protein [bacterium]